MEEVTNSKPEKVEDVTKPNGEETGEVTNSNPNEKVTNSTTRPPPPVKDLDLNEGNSNKKGTIVKLI